MTSLHPCSADLHGLDIADIFHQQLLASHETCALMQRIRKALKDNYELNVHAVRATPDGCCAVVEFESQTYVLKVEAQR